MRLFPIFINSPTAKIFKNAFPVIHETGIFSFHVLPLDEELLEVMHEIRPCICVFSVTSFHLKQKVKRLLEIVKRRRNPTIRVIVLAEGEGLKMDSWAQFGIHEYIPAPVTPQTLMYKIIRHFYKALSALDETTNEPEYVKPTRVVSLAESKEGKVRVFKAPKEESREDSIHRFKVVAQVSELSHQKGVWRISAAHQDGFDEVWQWSEKDAGGSGKTWFFKGDKPVYHAKKGVWVFKGEQPKLYSYRGKASPLPSGKANIEFELNEGALNLNSDSKFGEVVVQRETFHADLKVTAKEKEVREGETVSAYIPESLEQIIQQVERWEPKKKKSSKKQR